jgi:hypothetical protein
MRGFNPREMLRFKLTHDRGRFLLGEGKEEFVEAHPTLEEICGKIGLDTIPISRYVWTN